MHDLPGLLTSYIEGLGAQAAFKGWLGFIVGVLGAALGGVWRLVVVLMTLMLLDYMLGFARAWKTHDLRRSKGIAGLGKFIFYSVAWFVAALVEESIHGVFPVRDVVIGYMCAHEGLSCFEHLAYFGVPLPTGLRTRLREYRDTIACTAAKSGAEGR